jgi:hypothetical protein
MSGLAESLAELEHTLRRAGAVVASHFRLGLEPSTIKRRLGEIGLVPSDEVVEWFRWHDGAGDPNATLRNCEIAPGVYIFDLDTLCREYVDTRRNFGAVTEGLPEPWSDSSDLWSPSWFPLARLDAGYVAVDLGGSVSTSPVHVGWFDADPEYKLHPQWPTVEAFVQALIMRYEDGTYQIDPDGYVRGPDVDADLPQLP